MDRCSQIVKQFVCADFRILTCKFFCFAFGYMAASPNTKKIPRRLVAITLSNVFASSLNKTATASHANRGAQLAQKRKAGISIQEASRPQSQ
jgi:hypothetical protein